MDFLTTRLLGMSTGAIIGIVIAVVVVLLIIILVSVFISIRNKLVRLANNCDESLAGIDVYLKKRYDLIPNLVETVKGYAKHESQTLERVIAARNAAMTSSGDAKVNAENALSGTLKSLFALQESYPQLKADSQFLSLQSQLQSIENELAQSRKFYNGNIKKFNTTIQIFPHVIIANMMKLEKRVYFEITDDAERQNVKVSF